MDVSPEVIELGVRLAESAARNTYAMVTEKIRSYKQAAADQETIAGLEQIINDLIGDKAELTRIARSYQQELVAQRLNPGDVQYITNTIVPLLTSLADGSGTPEEGEKLKEQIETFKPLLSPATVNVLQLLGFNFRQAIGEPLTKLLESLILSQVKTSSGVEIENAKFQRLMAEIAQDPEAYARYRSFMPGS